MDPQLIKDPSGLYDQVRFSDLTIKLSNGESIKVHKTVLCTKNEYFNKLCGPESRFAERDQPAIEFKGDDPEALKGLLRHLYGFPVASWPTSWRFWLALYSTADKYLEPQLSKHALDQFRILASVETDTDELISIIKVIETDLEYSAPLAEISAAIFNSHHASLCQDKSFWELLGCEEDIVPEMS